VLVLVLRDLIGVQTVIVEVVTALGELDTRFGLLVKHTVELTLLHHEIVPFLNVRELLVDVLFHFATGINNHFIFVLLFNDLCLRLLTIRSLIIRL